MSLVLLFPSASVQGSPDTRLYLPSSGESPLPALADASAWSVDVSGSFFRAPTSTQKTDSPLASFATAFPNVTSQSMCAGQWASPPLVRAYDFTSADSVDLVVSGWELASAVDASLTYCVRVVSGDGITQRGMLSSRIGWAGTEFVGEFETRIDSQPFLGNVSAQAGDRIVIEIGAHGSTPSAGNPFFLRFGDPIAYGDFPLASGLNTALCPWVDLHTAAAIEFRMSAHGGIALSGSANLGSVSNTTPLEASGTLGLDGSALLRQIFYGPAGLLAAGTLTVTGAAALSIETSLAARGSITVAGSAWLTPRAHGVDSLTALGCIRLDGRACLRADSDPELPPTDDDGWTAPDVTIPDLRGLVVKVGGLSVKRAQMTDLVIELDTEGGPKSATLSVNCELTRAPRLMQTLEVTYKGQTLFPKKGRLEHIASNVDSSTGYTLTYAGPLVTLRDHKAYRQVFVDSDLGSWRVDQGPQTSPDTFEGITAGV